MERYIVKAIAADRYSVYDTKENKDVSFYNSFAGATKECSTRNCLEYTASKAKEIKEEEKPRYIVAKFYNPANYVGESLFMRFPAGTTNATIDKWVENYKNKGFAGGNIYYLKAHSILNGIPNIEDYDNPLIYEDAIKAFKDNIKAEYRFVSKRTTSTWGLPN